MKKCVSSLQLSIIFFSCCLLYALIGITLFWMQGINYTIYRDLGHKQYALMLTQLPPRSPIFDCTGKRLLAMNKDQSSAFIIPNQIADRIELDAFLQAYFPHAYTRLQQAHDKKFMYVQRKLSPEQIECIQNSGCRDIHIVREPGRYYPLPCAGCIIGITDSNNSGLFGIEYFYNNLLSGTPTTVFLEKDARSNMFYFSKDTRVSGKQGSTVQLTIDSDLQFLAYQALQDCMAKLEAQEGIVLIMNPDNGHILAMVNIPCFDPHNTKELNLDATKVRAITQQYELGSVFKVFVALAALEDNVVIPEELIDCKNRTTTYLDGRRINTVHAHGIIPFKDVVALSNNIGIAIVAKRLGTRLYDHYCHLGFGCKTGIELPGESAGFVNSPHNWSKQSLISLSYGYEVTATILQLGCAFCLIARGGVPVQPRLIVSADTMHPEQDNKPLYTQAAIDALREILHRTTQRGTARSAAIHGYTVMSKTGTAIMLDPITKLYNPIKNRYTCAGIVEKGDYKRVIVTFIQEAHGTNLFASNTVAPLFETIAEHMLIAQRVI